MVSRVKGIMLYQTLVGRAPFRTETCHRSVPEIHRLVLHKFSAADLFGPSSAKINALGSRTLHGRYRQGAVAGSGIST